MERRIPGSERTRETLSELIEGRLSAPDARSGPVRLATRLIAGETLEAESRDALGRGCCGRGGDPELGCRTGRMRTAEGAVEYTAPRTAGRSDPFRSKIRPELKKSSEGLKNLAVEMLSRGLSVRGTGMRSAVTTAACCSRAQRSRRSERGCGRITRSSPRAVPAAMTPPICSLTASPRGSGRGSGASPFWPPGA